MPKGQDWYPKSIVWTGPQRMGKNGGELRAVVAQDQFGTFRAGTRYGPGGCAMPELGAQEFWIPGAFAEKGKAIGAAKADTSWTLQGCDRQAATKDLVKSATTPGESAAPKPLRLRSRNIER